MTCAPESGIQVHHRGSIVDRGQGQAPIATDYYRIIFRVRVSDRRVEKITSSQQILSADVLTYTLTGLTMDGSPLVSFVHRNSDIYALELEMP